MRAFNYVAIESGLEDDPKLLSMTRTLGVKREAAFWYVYQWRVLVVQQGMPLTGALPKRYSAQDIASFVEFRGAGHGLGEEVDLRTPSAWPPRASQDR